MWIVAATLAATVLLLAVAASLAWQARSIPFPGLFTEPTLVVNQAGDQDWPGYAAGLHIPDHLVALDGQPLARVLQAGPEDYEQLIQSSSAAFARWRLVPAPRRGEIVRQIGEALRAKREALGQLVRQRVW